MFVCLFVFVITSCLKKCPLCAKIRVLLTNHNTQYGSTEHHTPFSSCQCLVSIVDHVCQYASARRESRSAARRAIIDREARLLRESSNYIL